MQTTILLRRIARPPEHGPDTEAERAVGTDPRLAEIIALAARPEVAEALDVLATRDDGDEWHRASFTLDSRLPYRTLRKLLRLQATAHQIAAAAHVDADKRRDSLHRADRLRLAMDWFAHIEKVRRLADRRLMQDLWTARLQNAVGTTPQTEARARSALPESRPGARRPSGRQRQKSKPHPPPDPPPRPRLRGHRCAVRGAA